MADLPDYLHIPPMRATIIRVILFSPLVFLAGLLIAVTYLRLTLHDPLFSSPYAFLIEDRGGELLGARIATDGQWRFPPSGEVPERFAVSILEFEDRHFHRHPGVNPVSVVRAAWQNYHAGRVVSGGSTLTMQVVRMSRGNPPRTVTEKLYEMMLAIALEWKYPKRDILSLYATHAPFGGNVVGLEAAAWRYFGRPPEMLTWAETATLSVLPNSPALIHPGRNRDQLRVKRDRLLERLRDRGHIDDLGYELALAETLPEAPHPLPMDAPHLLDRFIAGGSGSGTGTISRSLTGQVTGSVTEKDIARMQPGGSGSSYSNGNHNSNRLRSTLDGPLQRRTTAVIGEHRDRLAANHIHNLAALIVDVRSGEVLSYAGNAGYSGISGYIRNSGIAGSDGNEERAGNVRSASAGNTETTGFSDLQSKVNRSISTTSGFNRGHQVDVITAPRSPGSVLKPFLYFLQLNEGRLLPQMLVADIPTRVAGYAPRNFHPGYDGAVPAGTALARSLNIPAVRNLREYGVPRFHHNLQKMGMTTLNRPPEHYGLSLILGGAEATLWDVAGMYTSMAMTLQGYDPLDPGTLFWKQAKLHYDTDWRVPGGAEMAGTGAVNTADVANQDNPTSINRSDVNVNGQVRQISSRISADRDDKKPVRSISSDRNADRYDRDFPVNPSAIWETFSAMQELIRPDDTANWQVFPSSRRLAWKTGTSFGYRDGWAVGITPEYLVAVWVGNADGEGRPGLTGIGAAAPVMFDLFNLLGDTGWFREPALDMAWVRICRKSGHLAGPDCDDQQTEYADIPNPGLESAVCPYHRLIHVDAEGLRVNSNCYPVSEMRAVSHFVLPAVQEWYYRTGNEYEPLPAWREGCSPDEATPAMALIYPDESPVIYIPYEMDGSIGRTVFEAAHRRPGSTIWWHLNNTLIAETRGIHQISLNPDPGNYTLTLVDGNGETLSHRFRISGRE
ncbi:MAG: penicillin-binding protein 1C [Cyclonatronaceae bacterium]